MGIGVAFKREWSAFRRWGSKKSTLVFGGGLSRLHILLSFTAGVVSAIAVAWLLKPELAPHLNLPVWLKVLGTLATLGVFVVARKWGAKQALLYSASLLLVGVLAKLYWPPPTEWLTFDYWSGEAAVSRSEVFQNLALVLLAGIGLLFGTWRAYTAYRQVNVAEQGNITERFSTAAEHLGSEKLPVRLGGIYALWRLAHDSPTRDLQAVVDILCAYIRNPPYVNDEPLLAESNLFDGPKGRIRIRSDLQAIVNLLCGEGAPYRRFLPADYQLDWSKADLRGADLRGCNLDDFNLSYANLQKGSLIRSTLQRANLYGAHLTGAHLAHADLRWSELIGAQCENATFTGADLREAVLIASDFRNAKFTKANLKGAQVGLAVLAGAVLLDTTGLTHTQLTQLCPSSRPSTLPSGLEWPFVQKDGKWVNADDASTQE